MQFSEGMLVNGFVHLQWWNLQTGLAEEAFNFSKSYFCVKLCSDIPVKLGILVVRFIIVKDSFVLHSKDSSCVKEHYKWI